MTVVHWTNITVIPNSKHIVPPETDCGHWTGTAIVDSNSIILTLFNERGNEYIRITGWKYDDRWEDEIMLHLIPTNQLTFAQYENMLDAIHQAKSLLQYLKTSTRDYSNEN